MSHHTIVYSQAQAAATLTLVNALADTTLTVSGATVQVPGFAPNLAGYAAVGATLTAAQLESPSMKEALLPDFGDLNVGAEPSSPSMYTYFFQNPIKLVPSEALVARIAQSSGGSEQDSVMVQLSDGFKPMPSGELLHVKATASITCVAYTWTSGVITFSQTLPAGRYALVGAKCSSATGIAFRFINPGNGMRPGGLACDTLNDATPKEQQNGGLGVWLEFEHTAIPQLEMFCVSTDSSQTLILDLIKIA